MSEEMKDHAVPTGPFSWTDVYRAVERLEERMMSRFDKLETDMDQRFDHASEEREQIRGRITLLEQRNAIEDARNRGLANFGTVGMRIVLGMIALGQLVIAALLFFYR